MYVQELYKRNPKKFERFLLSDYPGIYSLKLDEINNDGIVFEIFANNEYYGRMIATDYYIDEPIIKSKVGNCRDTAKSIKLIKILTQIGGKDYIDKYTGFRKLVKQKMNDKFDCETEKIINQLNDIINNENKLK